MSVGTWIVARMRCQRPDAMAVEAWRHCGASRGDRPSSAWWRVLPVVVVLCVGAAAAAPSAVWGASVVAPGPCPPVMPVSEIKAATEGGNTLTASGLTVSQGTTPESFAVRVLGVLDGGIAPGVDMIIVEADSPALERVGGIWAGMSGSPVYAQDGRLIGAVSYGLSVGPSRIAGLTPAQDMVGVLGYDAATVARGDRARVRLSAALRREVTALPRISARQAAAGLVGLPVPVAVSGLRADHVEHLMRRLDPGGRTIPYPAGAVSADSGDPAQITPGSNFAAALSYGDVTAAGVGTTTAVCDGTALAFGHPFTFRGQVSLSAHTATAITIQDDPTVAPFKLANIGGTVGTVDQDRLVAIRAALGAAPTAVAVTSMVSDTGTGATRSGVTDINESRDVPMLAPSHLFSNIDRVIDRIGPGSSRVTWTLTGSAGGQLFLLTRENRFADLYDISFASSDELARQLAALQNNEFAAVTFTGLRIYAELAAQVRQYRIKALERQQAGRWVPVDPRNPIPAVAGQPLVLRARLSSYQGILGSRTVQFTLNVPADMAGSTATLEVRGGGATTSPSQGPAPEPSSFAELLSSIQNALRNDEILAELRAGDDPTQPAAASARRRLADVVTGDITVSVNVQAPETDAARAPNAQRDRAPAALLPPGPARQPSFPFR